MKILLKWLNEYVKIDDLSAENIAQRLLSIGFEVESITRLDEGLEKVITGKIAEISQHPSADKLKVCSVDIGKKQPLTLVSGAPNINIDMIVPVAIEGASLPCGKIIAAENFKGVISAGMLCSGKELNITDDIIDGAEIDGILPLPSDIPLGVQISPILGLDDVLLDVAITANRPDCQSVYGIARELATALNRKLNPLDLNFKTQPYSQSVDTIPQVKVMGSDACPLYQGSYIKEVKVTNSPQWMRRRLCALGFRPINNIVDITNYVLLEVGQPLHAFDRQNIHGNINIRFAFEDEKITALDEKEYTLSSKNLVIADDERALVIAGVMGGTESGINENTKTVFLESARFARGGVRATSRALGLSTDSSKRYEKGVDFYSVDTGRRRALALISQLKAGKVVDILKSDGVNGGKIPTQRVINADLKRIDALLGIKIPSNFVKKTLTALGFEVNEINNVKNKNGIYAVSIPLYREDVDNYTDLAEEAIRFYGYDKLAESSVTSLPTTIGGVSDKRSDIEKIEVICNAFGAFETKNFSFIPKKAYDLLGLPPSDFLRNCIEIINPLSEDYAVMRTQLVFSMLQAVGLNTSRQNDNFRIYEIDNAFLPVQNEMPVEQKTLCTAFVGAKEDFYCIKELAETVLKLFNAEYKIARSNKPWLHPGISADIICDTANQKTIGSFGKIHPLAAENFGTKEDVYLLELNLEQLFNLKQKNIKFKPLPKFPSVERDLSLTVDESVTVGELQNQIKRAGHIIIDVSLADIYRGAQIPVGKKSVTLRITLQSEEKTLVEKEISDIMNNAIASLKEKFNAALRE